MSKPHKADGKYLWWCLTSLEFKPDTAVKNIKHLNLGINMFDKPNKEGFYIVSHFLFEKLNPTRAQEAFRHCWPVWDHKCNAEFRKVTLGWLQEIAREEGSSFPKVAASHLLSPSGPRFINLMLHLAKHVMLKALKTFTTIDSWAPEAAAVPARSQELEKKRFQVVMRQFQRVTVGQDRLIQEYQKRAKGLEKSLRDFKAEDAKNDNILQEDKSNTDLLEDILPKSQKVRDLWAETYKVLSTLEGKREVMESVIHGQVDQYTLDGKDLNVKIPSVLLDRMERLSHKSSVSSLYEEGQPMLVRLLELLNEGLGLLIEERERIVRPTTQLGHQALQEHALLFSRSKENLKLIRHKLIKEDAPEIKSSIRRLEEDWDRRWAECLINTPLTSFLKEDNVLDFVSPMAPLSFEPASEASFKACILSQYPSKLPELLEQTSKINPEVEKTEVHLMPEVLNTSLPDEDKGVLLSSDCCFSPKPAICDAPPCETPLVHPVKVQSVVQTPSPVQACHRKTQLSKTKSSIVKNKEQILDLECDNLFAEAVIMSPVNGRIDVDLGQLLNSISDPFSTRKQLCRTPESLINDVRSSWRKAVEEGMAEKKQASWNQQDSLSWLKTSPTEDERNGLCHEPSPEPSLLFDSTATHPQCNSPVQQGSSHSTVSWDSSQLEALDSQSSSDIIKFSIAQEELLEVFDMSFNSDRSVEIHTNKESDQELVLPPVASHSLGESSLQMAHMCLDATSDKSSFMDSCFEKFNYMHPVQSGNSPGLNPWARDERLFSLDLDKLESISPPASEKLALPSLVNLNLDEY
ncbi:HAUS augmin-like complex subunit 6 isoform X2 [Myxocyprinus asiaticus]|uniref:HAUS augmin-like complex subunit 6 isoform X2 n=1 Tax=Myxocyprinus asiaticus TaxID=70543 RepID=UPI002223D095|nr:HAUS augmin-like complex subunit 6 isoform X2 [Myxocyprinus asiaticus]